MKLSKMHIKTLREVPSEAEIPSHILLLRAGMITKLVSGIYGFLPLGRRVLRKIEDIIREEMDERGGEEILMSAIQPAELWEESGRWNAYGPEMWRLTDRHGRSFCLGPTHEEIFTDLARRDITSYRQLPARIYQIQTKYRDEARPRFGLMRSREFIMKDLYSFDRDEAGLDESYKAMYEAYDAVFKRCGLDARPVEADTGAIGGNASHEFTALSSVGESEIASCDSCGLATTVERGKVLDAKPESGEELELEKVHTPSATTIEEVAKYLEIDEARTIKALLFVVDDEDSEYYVAAFIRGDRELNMTKLVNALGIAEHSIAFADEEAISKTTGCVGGFTGPIGLKNCKLIVDSELVHMKNLVAGANEKDYHIKNVNYGRDYEGDIVVDIKTLKEGYPCPVCGNPVKITRGIEVGQVFKLGDKYSKAMRATYKDEEQKDRLMLMGCYGIGVSRTLAAIVEQHHDDNGIIWPISVAPFHVMVTVINPAEDMQLALASDIYEKLKSKGVEVILDDRKERPGVKFKDADLMGFPINIIVGRRATENIVEYKLRAEGEKEELHSEEAVNRAVKLVVEQRDGRNYLKEPFKAE